MMTRASTLESLRSITHLAVGAIPVLVFFLGAGRAGAQMPGQNLPGLPPISAARSDRGIRATMGSEVLDIVVCSDSVIHIVAKANAAVEPAQKPWMLDASQSCPGAPFQFAHDAKTDTIKTKQLEVAYSLDRGNVSFRTLVGDTLLREGNSLPRTYEPVQLNGENTFRITDRFSPRDCRGSLRAGPAPERDVQLPRRDRRTGHRTTLMSRSLSSSRASGYAFLWNTASLTYVDNRFPLELSFTSIAGKSIDYYFIYRPGDRHPHPRIPDHDRPHTDAAEVGLRILPVERPLCIAGRDTRVSRSRYRDEHIPLDTMVQDWFWWKTEGDPAFNNNYHDVTKDLDTLHQLNVHAMISVWGLLDPESETYRILDAKHLLIPGAHVYDPSSSEGRDIYWERLPGKLLAQGWDAFWLDSAEPEEYWPHMGDGILRNKELAIGNGAEYTNVFPLLHTLGVQDHWKATTQSKRVFLLTRSAFLGQQRVGATVWSGDVYGTYWGLSHQVPAGLNFALSGNPYWTTDIGGYWPPHNDPLAERRLSGALCALVRVRHVLPHLPNPRPPSAQRNVVV